MRRGISHSRRFGATTEAYQLALLRHWFWMRKPDAGFLLTDFPATMLQAQVFDEWLEARNEALDQVIPMAQSALWVVEHYRDLGLLPEESPEHASLQ